MNKLTKIHDTIMTLEATLTEPDSILNRLDVLVILKKLENDIGFIVEFPNKADAILNDSKDMFVGNMNNLISDLRCFISFKYN